MKYQQLKNRDRSLRRHSLGPKVQPPERPHTLWAVASAPFAHPYTNVTGPLRQGHGSVTPLG